MRKKVEKDNLDDDEEELEDEYRQLNLKLLKRIRTKFKYKDKFFISNINKNKKNNSNYYCNKNKKNYYKLITSILTNLIFFKSKNEFFLNNNNNKNNINNKINKNKINIYNFKLAKNKSNFLNLVFIYLMFLLLSSSSLIVSASLSNMNKFKLNMLNKPVVDSSSNLVADNSPNSLSSSHLSDKLIIQEHDEQKEEHEKIPTIISSHILATSTTTNSFTISNSKKTIQRKFIDSSNLKLEFCDDCNLYLGGLFPIHAPKYARQTVNININSNPNSNLINLTKNLSSAPLESVSFTVTKQPIITSSADQLVFNSNNLSSNSKLNHHHRHRANTNYHNNTNSGLPSITSDDLEALVSSASVPSSSPFLSSSTTINTVRLDENVDVEYEEDNLNELSCGEIKKERGIQRLEAMLYAIDLINNSTTLLPNLKLGAKIYDTCDRDTIALEKCINFVSDHFLLNDENIVNDFTCEPVDNNNKQATKTFNQYSDAGSIKYLPRKKQDVIYKRKVIGVIGAASSSVSIQVANLLRLFQVPQISYASTSPELSNKERFPYFSRVLPSDRLQAEAMAALVHSLEWNYITTINEEGNLGGIDSFVNIIKNKKICISESYTLSQTASEESVGNILKDMYEKKKARAVVMFLQDHNIRKLLKSVSNLNLTNHFLWVASDSWGTKKESISSNNLAAASAITFSPKFYEIKEFNEHFKNLKPKTNTRNPWFLEFWEEQFNCTLNYSLSISHASKLSKRLCTGEESLNVTQDGFIHFVIDSVFAMAHAVHNLLDIYCANLTNKDLIDCQHNTALKGSELLKAIRNVEFTSVTGRKVKFLRDKENSGDGLAPFEVFQYQEYEPNKYRYEKIAEWDSENQLLINKTKLKWRDGTTHLPRSVCKEECEIGEVKQGDDCCWVCVKCDETQYVSEDRKQCIKCKNGYGPNPNKTSCQKLPVEYLTFNSAFTLVPIIFSSLGIIVTSYCVFIFIRFNDTPIIKASGRELCYVLLAGIMSCYLITFPLVTKPTQFSCAILRFGVSLSLTICLSALFTKTNRLSRIFNNSVKQVRQASYVSPQSQLVICFSIISVQIIGILIWIVMSPPGTSYDYDDPKRVILQCKTQNIHLAISFAYNMVLVILCTIYAVKTRKIPENFNEARFIGFTMYSICIIWVAFIPIYFGTTAAAGTRTSPKNNYKIQLTTMAMCLSLSATVVLFCLFFPKIRVVLLKPNKNVRSKSSNIVKSVYKNHHQSLRESTVTTTVPIIVEKSLTLATGISSGSTPSSPGLQIAKKNQMASAFNNNSSGQLTTQTNQTTISEETTTTSSIGKPIKTDLSKRNEDSEDLDALNSISNNENISNRALSSKYFKQTNSPKSKLKELNLKSEETRNSKNISTLSPNDFQAQNNRKSSLVSNMNNNLNPNNSSKRSSIGNDIPTSKIGKGNSNNSLFLNNIKAAATNAINTAVDNLQNLSIRLSENSSIKSKLSDSSIGSNHSFRKTSKDFSSINRNDYKNDNEIKEAACELGIDYDNDYASDVNIPNGETKQFLLNKNNQRLNRIRSQESKETSSEDYEYLVKPRLLLKNSNNLNRQDFVKRAQFKADDFSVSDFENESQVLFDFDNPTHRTTTTVPPVNVISVDEEEKLEEEFDDKTIKAVVEKCFDQLSKNKKIATPCIYVTNKVTSSPSKQKSDQKQELESSGVVNSKNQIDPNYKKDFENNKNSSTVVKEQNNNVNNNTMIRAAKSLTKINETDLVVDNYAGTSCNSSASGRENSNLKETVVDRSMDILNGPTNTILLSSSNDISELYSLKITFV